MRHIIYLPGLGDRFDGIRKLGLRLWRSKDVRVSHIPMKWSDLHETFEEKLARVKQVIDSEPEAETTLVGESAGGAMAIAALGQYKDKLNHVVTLCGMNHGAENVNPALYLKNPAFREAMISADTVIPTFSSDEKKKLYIIYSSGDSTVRPRSSLVEGVVSYDLKIPGHSQSILVILFWRYKLILKKVSP